MYTRSIRVNKYFYWYCQNNNNTVFTAIQLLKTLMTGSEKNLKFEMFWAHLFWFGWQLTISAIKKNKCGFWVFPFSV